MRGSPAYRLESWFAGNGCFERSKQQWHQVIISSPPNYLNYMCVGGIEKVKVGGAEEEKLCTLIVPNMGTVLVWDTEERGVVAGCI